MTRNIASGCGTASAAASRSPSRATHSARADCARCRRLAASGVAAVKIAGREGPLARKLRSVEMVQQTRLNLGQGEAAAQAVARNLRRRPDLCDTGDMCYHR